MPQVCKCLNPHQGHVLQWLVINTEIHNWTKILSGSGFYRRSDVLTSGLQWPTHVQLKLLHLLTPEPAWHPEKNKEECDQGIQWANASWVRQTVTNLGEMGRRCKGIPHYYNKQVCCFSSGSWSLCGWLHRTLPTRIISGDWRLWQ